MLISFLPKSIFTPAFYSHSPNLIKEFLIATNKIGFRHADGENEVTNQDVNHTK